MFQSATRKNSKLRMAIDGVSGSGKTYSSLKLAGYLCPGGRIAVIDTERGSSELYANVEGLPKFDVCKLTSFSPDNYIKAIKFADKEGYDVLIIDSFSHAWVGKDGALEMADAASKKSRSGNSYVAWREITPKHNELVDTILDSKCHVFVTMRTKTEYVQEQDAHGKMKMRKLGTKVVQREGLEYEFDLVADMTLDNDMLVDKTRCPLVKDKVFHNPGKDLADILRVWLDEGEVVPEEPVFTSVGQTPDTSDDVSTEPTTAEVLQSKLTDAQELSDLGIIVKEILAAKQADLITDAERSGLLSTYQSTKARIEANV